MSDIIKSAILGIVEGITEYLPVSSTGHLIIFNEWLSFDTEFSKVFDIFIQSGAILAAIIIFWKDLFPAGERLKKVFDNWKKMIVAFVPAAIAGLLFADGIRRWLFNPITVAIALIVGGVLFFLIDKKDVAKTDAKEAGELHVSYTQALVIGIAQCCALIPGVSRSASTIFGGLFVGLDRRSAAAFSFLLAIPTLGAAGAYSLLKDYKLLAGNIHNIELLAVGFFVSFVVAYAVIRWFLGYIARHNFWVFGWYRIALGSIILGLYYAA
jgi:undecaprenyl-diphosphatase